MEKIEKSVILVLSTSSVVIALFFVLCSSANATAIELLDDSIHMATAVWFDGFSGVVANDIYDGHFFGNHVEVESSTTVENPGSPGDFTTYSVWARANHTSTDFFTIGDMGAGYDWGDLVGLGTATVDVVLTYEFSVKGAGSRLEIDGPSAFLGFPDYSLSLVDETLGVAVTDGMGTAGTGFFDLLDSHIYRLDFGVSMVTHGDPDPGPSRVFNFRNVDYVAYVPEPSSLLLFSAGLFGLIGIRRKRKK